MSLTYGFYNSLNGDRKYNADQMSSIFDGIINDGIYMSIGTQFMVKSTSGMTIKVGEGRAWFNHTWTLNDSEILLELEPSELLLNRIDAVVLEVNHSEGVRANSIKIVKGEGATNPLRPTLINNSYVQQHALAYIDVSKGVNEITQANITNMIGTSDTPFVTGIIQTINIDDLIAQWEAEWDAWVAATELENTQWTSEQRSVWLTWVAQQEEQFSAWLEEYQGELEAIKTNLSDYSKSAQKEFEAWFALMKSKLSDDVAGHLQNQVDAIIEREFNRYYGLIAKETAINKDQDGNTIDIVETSDEAVSTTTFEENSAGKTIVTEIIPTDGLFKYIKTTLITTTDSGKTITESYSRVSKEV